MNFFKQFSAKRPLTYLISEGEATLQNFHATSREILQIIEAAMQANISLIQIREKKLPAKLLYKLTAAAAEITNGSSTKLLVNDRADIALAARADGVQLTSVSLPIDVIKRNFPAGFIIGFSAHSLQEVETAEKEGADFVTFSPIYETPSKAVFGKPQGLETLREVCENVAPFPVLALGGIRENNIQEVLNNGASGYAAIRFLVEKFKPQDSDDLPKSQNFSKLL